MIKFVYSRSVGVLRASRLKSWLIKNYADNIETEFVQYKSTISVIFISGSFSSKLLLEGVRLTLSLEF